LVKLPVGYLQTKKKLVRVESETVSSGIEVQVEDEVKQTEESQQSKRRNKQKGKVSSTSTKMKDGSLTEIASSSVEAQEERKVEDLQASQQPKPKGKASGKASTKKKSDASLKSDCIRKRKALNKSEKDSIKTSISNMRPEVTATIALANVRKQLPANSSDLETFYDSVNSVSVSFLTDHLQQMFVTLYEECCKSKERHMATSN